MGFLKLSQNVQVPCSTFRLKHKAVYLIRRQHCIRNNAKSTKGLKYYEVYLCKNLQRVLLCSKREQSKQNFGRKEQKPIGHNKFFELKTKHFSVDTGTLVFDRYPIKNFWSQKYPDLMQAILQRNTLD